MHWKNKVKYIYKKVSPYLLVIMLVLGIFLWFSGLTYKHKVNTQQKEINALKGRNDSLYLSNKINLNKYKATITYLDSIHQLTLQSNENEINNKWDSIYNSILADDGSFEFITNYLDNNH